MTYTHFTDADHLRQQTAKVTRVLAEAMFLGYMKLTQEDNGMSRNFSVQCRKKDEKFLTLVDHDMDIRSLCFLAALDSMRCFCAEHGDHIDLICEEMTFLLSQEDFFMRALADYVSNTQAERNNIVVGLREELNKVARESKGGEESLQRRRQIEKAMNEAGRVKPMTEDTFVAILQDRAKQLHTYLLDAVRAQEAQMTVSDTRPAWTGPR